ncbi:MAG TPA: hydrogenase expression/formation protein HypE, partial [Firmicutes bacterium]|nr:hydrogenase expression/formation protein HypE [Bacillota bacterium]
GASACRFQLEEEKLPVKPAVRDLCGLLGIDPLYMGNEGCLVAVVPQEQAEKALNALRACGQGSAACQIGQVEAGDGALFLRTSIGGQRRLEVLQGEGLPRIC